MGGTRTAALVSAVTEAALAVPGVAGLQPRLVHRLTEAVSPVLPQTLAEHTPSPAGVRAVHAPDGSGWRIEVRCAVVEDNRVLDTARNIHERVRFAVLAHLAEHNAVEAVAVTVTVIRIASPPPRGAPPLRFT